jgi:hypothetical protein
MKKKTEYFIILIFCCGFSSAFLQGQEVISPTGGNATGSSGSVSYTIGQILYSTFSGTNGSVVQGVQQPYEISILTAIENSEGITLDCMVYPNPTSGFMKLIVESFDYENLRFRLYDINGILLQDKKVESKETVISMESLSASIYFLKVTKENKEVKVFKIVKK